MKNTLKHKDANVVVEKLENGNNKISVELLNDELHMPIKSCETSYPINLIENILNLKGPSHLCDEILRDDSTTNEFNIFKYHFFSYEDEKNFKNKRLLDFGCGSGASTMKIARMLPNMDIVGVELEKNLLKIARHRAEHYGYKNIDLKLSPSPNELPENIGSFDFISLCAVYEHLLPNERIALLPKLWKLLKPNGILFINGTPNRCFPIEKHTTLGLPLINYLPDKIALFYAQRFSKRKLQNSRWDELLRRGIRGGRIKEIIKILNTCSEKPILLEPKRLGIKNRIDLSYNVKLRENKLGLVKSLYLFSINFLRVFTGITLVPYLTLAIKKSKK